MGSRGGLGKTQGPQSQALAAGLVHSPVVTMPSFSEQVQAGDPEAEEAGGYREPLESGGHTSSQAAAPKDLQPLAGQQINLEQNSSQPAWSPPHSTPLGDHSTQLSTQQKSGWNPLSLYCVQSANLRIGGSRYGGRTRPWDSLPSRPTTVDIIGPDAVQALTQYSHRLPGGEGEAPRHHSGSCRQLCL